jgi:hypothetical protein
MACIKLAPIGNSFAAGNATAKLYRISPTDVLVEESPEFSLEAFVTLSHMNQLYCHKNSHLLPNVDILSVPADRL